MKHFGHFFLFQPDDFKKILEKPVDQNKGDAISRLYEEI